jgi:hypothetical protein
LIAVSTKELHRRQQEKRGAGAEARQSDDAIAAEQHTGTPGFRLSDQKVTAIVRVQAGDTIRLLRVMVAFEIDTKNYAKINAELRSTRTKLHALLVNLLYAMTPEELHGPDGQALVGAEYLKIVNASIPPGVGQVNAAIVQEYTSEP